MKIAIGADHAGFALKQLIGKQLGDTGISVNDKGAYSEERTDYADYGHAVADSVLKGEVDFGVLICGSGNGIAMAANKHKGIRAALCWAPELAVLARQHNDANVLVLPARFISNEVALACVTAFLKEKFEGGRHLARVQKIDV